MARDTKTDTPAEADKAAKQVPLIDTRRIVPDVEETVDPDLENRPGVLPDPKQPDIDPVTNLRHEQLDPATGGPLPNALQPPVLNERVAQPRARVEKPTGKKIRMRAVADIWPASKPPADWPEGQEYRIRAGQEVDLPEEEAMDRMEAGTAVRANPRA